MQNKYRKNSSCNICSRRQNSNQSSPQFIRLCLTHNGAQNYVATYFKKSNDNLGQTEMEASWCPVHDPEEQKQELTKRKGQTFTRGCINEAERSNIFFLGGNSITIH